MRVVLFILSVIAFLVGVDVLAAAKSAIHEIEAFILFLISAVFLVGASVVGAVNVAREKIEPFLQAISDSQKTLPETIRASRDPARPLPVAAKTKQAAQHSFSYFFVRDGADSGPHTLAEMLQFWQSGTLSSETLVVREGDSEWRPFCQFPEFRQT